MKRKVKLLFVIYFFILCILPVGCMGITSATLSENRNLSEWPEWTREDGSFNSSFFQEVQTYLAEHFAFRSQLVEADSILKYKLFHSPSDEQVIIGRDGWLFFDSTLNDYAGVTLEQERIEEIAENLSEVCCFLEDQGSKPLIMVVPNKNSIYPEYMPARFGDKAKVSNLTLLQQAMDEKGIPYLDAYAVLTQYKTTDELYLHEDTHWNNTGARLILNAVYDRLGIADRYSLEGYTLETSHEPDLYQILFPAQEHYENQRIYPQGNDFDYVGRVRSMDDLTIESCTDQGNGSSILVYRDSFGRAMIPYMSEVFDSATYNRSTPYDLTIAEDGDYDYIIIEIVERNIADLGDIVIP